KLAAYIHVALARRASGIVAALEAQRGQGTVEYVGLILLVSLLMVGMVAAMKGLNGKQGTELADLIVNKIKQAVNSTSPKCAIMGTPNPRRMEQQMTGSRWPTTP